MIKENTSQEMCTCAPIYINKILPGIESDILNQSTTENCENRNDPELALE